MGARNKMGEIINKQLRRRIIEKAYAENLEHNSSALSCVDAIAYLYSNVLREQDMFILSKGHGAMALYAVLETQGKKVKWEMHPEHDEANGIYATTGSLGHGLPIAVGRAYAKKLRGDNGRVYVLTGDGEMEEGSVWEALCLANRFEVNLNLLVDWNKYQVAGNVEQIAKINRKSLDEKLRAFGCRTVFTVNGHSPEALQMIGQMGDGLNAVVLDTIKGRGVKILEDERPHGFSWKSHPEEYKKALEELR